MSSSSASFAACCADRPRISSLVCATRSRNCERWPVRALRRDSNSFCSPATAVVADGSWRPFVNCAGNTMASASSRSASSRASRASNSSSCERTTPSVALVTVSSSRSTIWPASTSAPSLTRISPTTPPVGCWTFLTLDSTTMVPGAITAPASCVVAAQPPTPPTRKTVMANPTRLSLRIVRRGSCWVTSGLRS